MGESIGKFGREVEISLVLVSPKKEGAIPQERERGAKKWAGSMKHA